MFFMKTLFTRSTGQLCCAGIFDSQAFWKQKEQALDGEFISMSRYRGNVIADRDSTVTQCDITATNGVVHAIDEVGKPGWRFEEPYIWSQGTILLDQTVG